MSTAELDRLVADVKADEALQEKVKSIHPTNEAVVEWANAHGYEITLEELDAYIREKKGELTEEDLDRVVGGKGPSYDWTVTNQQGVSHTYTPRQLAGFGHDMFIAHPMIEQVDQGWAGYKDTYTADKARVQDASSQDLMDAAQSHGATVDQSGTATDITFNDGISIVQQIEPNGVDRTNVSLRDGNEITHNYTVGSGGEHESDGTDFCLPDGSIVQDQGGEILFYSGPGNEWFSKEAPGEIEVENFNTLTTSTTDVDKTLPAAEVTVTTDQGNSEYQVTLPEAAQDWAAHPEAPAAWTDPSAQIDVKGTMGWELDHSDTSGPDTTFTSASGTEFVLPHAVTTTDWTITNSQGDSRVFTPEQIYRGEVNQLEAHPTFDQKQFQGVKEKLPDRAQIGSTMEKVTSTWNADKPIAESDWNAAKKAGIANAQDPEVQSFEQLSGSWTYEFQGPHEATVGTDNEGKQVVTADLGPSGSAFAITHVSANSWDSDVYGNAAGKSLWEIGNDSSFAVYLNYGGPEGDSDDDVFVSSSLSHQLVYNADNPQEPWSIQLDPGREWAYESGPHAEITWGSGELAIQGNHDHRVTFDLQNGSGVEVGPAQDGNTDASGQFLFQSVSGEKTPTILVTSQYGEQWTIEQGDQAVTTQSAEESLSGRSTPSAPIGSGITEESYWTITDSSGQVVRQYDSNRFDQDRENWEIAHPQAAQGIATWTTDKETYETGKQMWSEGGGDPQGLPDGTVSGSKGDVSYTLTPGVPGESGYDLEITGPDTNFNTDTTDYNGVESRWVSYDSDKSGTEVDGSAVYSNGQVENFSVNDFSFVRQEGSQSGQVRGPRGDYVYSPVVGLDDRTMDTQVVLPDGEVDTLTRQTQIFGEHDRSVSLQQVPDAGPEVSVELADGTNIAWEKTGKTISQDGNALWQANMEYFDVSGPGGQVVDWSPGGGMTQSSPYFDKQIGAATPWENTGEITGNMETGDSYRVRTNAGPAEITTSHATVEILPEYGYYSAKEENTYFETNEVAVEFNDGLTLVHQPHFTAVYEGPNYAETALVEPAAGDPVELLAVNGSVDQVDGKEIRPQGQVSVENPRGGTLTWTPGVGSPSGYVEVSFEGAGGNVFTESFGPQPAYSLDGVQLHRGQDASMMGPDGRISVEWGVAAQDLPDGSSLSGTDSGFVIQGTHQNLQVVRTQQEWVIDNERVISPSTYLSNLDPGIQVIPGADDPAAATNEAVFSQVAVATNVAVAADEAAAVQTTVFVEAELFLFMT